MLHLKETALRDKFESYRASLDSSYNSTHSRLSDKLHDLAKEVTFLKENLSKSVVRVMTAKKNSEKPTLASESKFKYT